MHKQDDYLLLHDTELDTEISRSLVERTTNTPSALAKLMHT